MSFDPNVFRSGEKKKRGHSWLPDEYVSPFPDSDTLINPNAILPYGGSSVAAWVNGQGLFVEQQSEYPQRGGPFDDDRTGPVFGNDYPLAVSFVPERRINFMAAPLD